MATGLNTEAVESAARALLDDRIGAVRRLAQAQQTCVDKRDELVVAEREHAAAYTAAQRAGWTIDELRKVGFTPPAKKAPGRPRRRTAVAAASD